MQQQFNICALLSSIMEYLKTVFLVAVFAHFTTGKCTHLNIKIIEKLPQENNELEIISTLIPGWNSILFTEELLSSRNRMCFFGTFKERRFRIYYSESTTENWLQTDVFDLPLGEITITFDYFSNNTVDNNWCTPPEALDIVFWNKDDFWMLLTCDEKYKPPKNMGVILMILAPEPGYRYQKHSQEFKIKVAQFKEAVEEEFGFGVVNLIPWPETENISQGCLAYESFPCTTPTKKKKNESKGSVRVIGLLILCVVIFIFITTAICWKWWT